MGHASVFCIQSGLYREKYKDVEECLMLSFPLLIVINVNYTKQWNCPIVALLRSPKLHLCLCERGIVTCQWPGRLPEHAKQGCLRTRASAQKEI